MYEIGGQADIRSFVTRLGGTVEIAHEDEAFSVRSKGDFTVFLPAPRPLCVTVSRSHMNWGITSCEQR